MNAWWKRKKPARLYVPRLYPSTPESRAIADEVERLTIAALKRPGASVPSPQEKQ